MEVVEHRDRRRRLGASQAAGVRTARSREENPLRRAGVLSWSSLRPASGSPPSPCRRRRARPQSGVDVTCGLADDDLSQAEVSLAKNFCNAVLTGLAGEDEITDDRSVRQVEFARVCGSPLRELHLGFRTSADPRNFTQRDARFIRPRLLGSQNPYRACDPAAEPSADSI